MSENYHRYATNVYSSGTRVILRSDLVGVGKQRRLLQPGVAAFHRRFAPLDLGAALIAPIEPAEASTSPNRDKQHDPDGDGTTAALANLMDGGKDGIRQKGARKSDVVSASAMVGQRPAPGMLRRTSRRAIHPPCNLTNTIPNSARRTSYGSTHIAVASSTSRDISSSLTEGSA
jgi:hypothetical protein